MRPALIGLGGLCAVLVLGLFTAFFALEHGGADGLLRSALSAKLKRPVQFQSAELRLLTKDPTVVLKGLHVTSPPEITRDALLDAQTVTLHLRPGGLWMGRVDLRAVAIDRAQLRLVRLGHARNNYTFGSGGSGSLLRGVDSLWATNSVWRMVDPDRHILVGGPLSHDGRPGAAWPLAMQAEGTVSEQPVTVSMRGAGLNGRRAGAPWAVDIQVKDGKAALHLKGAAQAPFDFRGFDLAVESTGPNLAVLGSLLRTEAPNSPPYRLTVRARRAEHVVKLTDLNAKIGNSAVTGTITSNHNQARRKVTANLSFAVLQAADLAILASPPAPHGQSRSEPGVKPKSGEVLGADKPFPLAALRRLDTEVDLRADRVEGYMAPLHDLRMALRLLDGRLTVKPISFELPAGRMVGDLTLDASKPIPTGSADLKLLGGRLSALQPKLRSVVDGQLDGTVRVSGAGSSPRALLADATGRAAFLGRGSLQHRSAAALGGDPASAVLKGGKGMEPVPCAFVTLRASHGVLSTDRLLIVTPEGYADGAGRLVTADGRLDLRLQGHPSRRFTASTPPIVIDGPIAHPKVHVDKPSVVAGAALSALAAPLAALAPKGPDAAGRCAGLANSAAAFMAGR